MRARLRPAWSEAELKEMYRVPHDHARWPDHVERVEQTIRLAKDLTPGPPVVADLSCGDAAIARALDAKITILGDLAPGYEITGPIERTIMFVPYADLFICSETAEHLDDPDTVLRKIRDSSMALVLSTPLSEFESVNPEHYWAWDHDGMREMLEEAGWTPEIQRDVIHPLARYQLWGCR